MAAIEVKSGNFTLQLEVDDETLQHFMINGDSSRARQFLLALVCAGYLDNSIWNEIRIEGHLQINIPSLDIEYILPPEKEVVGMEEDQHLECNENLNKNAVEPTGQFFWTHEGILNLISLYKENKDNFGKTSIRNEKIWRDITIKLKANGFGSPTPKQVEYKWKNLRKSYSKVVDNRGPNSSGAPSISFKYFDEFEEIYTTNPSYHPPTIASSMRSNSIDIIEPVKKEPKKKTEDILLQLIKDQTKRHDEIINEFKNATKTFADKLDKLIDKL